MSARAIALLAAAGAAPAAFADGVAYWLADVTTDDGDALVEPGETASITVSVLMEAFPGDAESVALSAAIFEILGDEGAAKGHILGWEIHNQFDELTGDMTTTDGVSLYNIQGGQLTTFGPFTDDNPADFITFQWTPDEYAPYDVVYHTESVIDDYPGTVFVWENAYTNDEELGIYPVAEAMIGFSVVPAPGGVVLLLAAPLAASRSRRRTKA